MMFPIGSILFAPYARTLFLLCAIETPWAALTALTCPQGLFPALPLPWFAWQWRTGLRALVPLLLIPVAMISWRSYRISDHRESPSARGRPQCLCIHPASFLAVGCHQASFPEATDCPRCKLGY